MHCHSVLSFVVVVPTKKKEQNSLMKCISDSLYLTTKYEMALYNVCQLYLVKLCREKVRSLSFRLPFFFLFYFSFFLAVCVRGFSFYSLLCQTLILLAVRLIVNHFVTSSTFPEAESQAKFIFVAFRITSLRNYVRI